LYEWLSKSIGREKKGNERIFKKKMIIQKMITIETDRQTESRGVLSGSVG
jgi:hypothetical protein